MDTNSMYDEYLAQFTCKHCKEKYNKYINAWHIYIDGIGLCDNCRAKEVVMPSFAIIDNPKILECKFE